ncbi:hypothetical protein [Gordonia sp. (in: high G+C Gram-positive bacteria)]|uniref:hypothetical protein n=1 Tax=Gordonia sp. (in: high G+C Gram-positive bacteria) TaxID=84139 RepID=UPI0039E4C28A
MSSTELSVDPPCTLDVTPNPAWTGTWDLPVLAYIVDARTWRKFCRDSHRRGHARLTLRPRMKNRAARRRAGYTRTGRSR